MYAFRNGDALLTYNIAMYHQTSGKNMPSAHVSFMKHMASVT